MDPTLADSKGQSVVTGNGTNTGSFFAMQVVADAVVASMTYEPDYGSKGNWTSLSTIPAGTTLFGKFSQLTLTSGKAVLYSK